MTSNSGKVLARNSIVNLTGQLVPIIVAIGAIPPTVRLLGSDRFGLLSLAWVVLGYFTVFDLGLGRASTKYVAEALATGRRETVPNIVWTVAVTQLGLGCIGGIALAACAPLLSMRILKVSPALMADAKAELYVVAIALPIMLLSISFSGVLEAIQRFDLVNLVKVPSSILVFVLSLLGGVWGLSLYAIVGLIVVTRLIALVCLAALATHALPELRRVSASVQMLRRLLGFGGWLTVSGVVGPSLVYLDRFMVASLVSMSAVAFYTAPYEAMSRIWIIPGSIASTLFPSFSSMAGTGEQERSRKIFASSIKYLFLIISPVLLAILFFAHDILLHWLGPAFADHSSVAMQILAGGFLINSLALIPAAYLQGIGRPDLPAKFHLLELPLHAVISFVLISRWGIAGAASAWTLRVLVDAILLLSAMWFVGGVRWHVSKWLRGFAFPALLGFAAVAGIGRWDIPHADALAVRIIGYMLLIAIFLPVLWLRILNREERQVLARLVKL